MRVRIELEIDEQYVKVYDPTGLTADGYAEIVDALGDYGEEITIERIDP